MQSMNLKWSCNYNNHSKIFGVGEMLYEENPDNRR